MSGFWWRLVATLSLVIMGGLLVGFFWSAFGMVWRSWLYKQADRRAQEDGWAGFREREEWEDRWKWEQEDAHKW